MYTAAISLLPFITIAAFAAIPGQLAPDGSLISSTYADSREGIAPPAVPSARGAPNIVWILLDDAGYGASSAFGGEIQTPNLEKLASEGLRYTNFHNAGVCSPTRAALLTGRNHHKVGMGLFPHKYLRAEFPGYTGRMSLENGTVAEYLRARGYSTFAVGKWHLTPEEETTDLGPFDRWPINRGFDHYFGFLGAATDQYQPDLVEDHTHVATDGRHLNEQLVDRAIKYIDTSQRLDNARPFFLYFATGATHSPHQVDRHWIDKYKGKFDTGWDDYRERVLAEQKAKGYIPANAVLPKRDPRVASWKSLSTDQKRVYRRFMEGYAGFFEYTDHEIGRLISYLDKIGVLENTAIFVMLGDNGASKEGFRNGSVDIEMHHLPQGNDDFQIQRLLSRYEQIGTRDSYSNYPMGWAQAMDTPYRRWKADADSEGGTRSPMIMHWPKALGKKSGIRNQYAHVIDLLPTALEISRTTPETLLNGVTQEPIQGISLVYSMLDASARTRHHEQYYFAFGSGAIVKDGWKASFSYRPDIVDLYGSYPPPKKAPARMGSSQWSLYNLNADPTEVNDLATKNPDKLEEMKTRFDTLAKENNVYPLINWTDLDRKVRQLLR